jgi:hypothetical protein
VRQAAVAQCGSDGCHPPSVKGSQRAQLKQAVEIVIDAALGAAGLSVPAAEVWKPLGSFAHAIFRTVAGEPAKTRIKRSIGDLAVRLVDPSFDPAGVALPSTPPHPRAMRQFHAFLAQRLESLSDRLRPPDATATMDTATTETGADAPQTNVPIGAAPVPAPTEQTDRDIVALPIAPRPAPVAARAAPVARPAPAAADAAGECVCHITYIRNGAVVGRVDRPQSCAAPCP